MLRQRAIKKCDYKSIINIFLARTPSSACSLRVSPSYKKAVSESTKWNFHATVFFFLRGHVSSIEIEITDIEITQITDMREGCLRSPRGSQSH